MKRSARCSRLGRVRNAFIREKRNIRSLILDDIKYKQFVLCGHMRRMSQRLLKKMNTIHKEEEGKESILK